eukprot:TRINITY_DN21049_c0_g1_i1.p1 TRINITY_DN21049_c0_g1~~TRINITY_DN21049_c0_g1_i1.p1  ORF type:complete len:426 (+),score=51.74 TRINITY_DN21049_c0_g1_i1:65-1279(+)
MGNARARQTETCSATQVPRDEEKIRMRREQPEEFQAGQHSVRSLNKVAVAPSERTTDEHPFAVEFESAMHCFRLDNGRSAPHARILAYGDSLTAGCHTRDSYGAKEFAPYGQYAVESLAPDFIIEFWACGLSGATAAHLAEKYESTSIVDVAEREGVGIEAALTLHGPFDLVLIMLGTHDLANAQQAGFPTPNLAQNIFRDIERVHTVCHECNTPTVVLSVPESRPYRLGLENGNGMYASYVDCWDQLNSSLRKWSAENRSWVKLFINTGEAMPFSRGSDLWESDGFHFSAAGSCHFGTCIAEALVPLIREISWRRKLDAAATEYPILRQKRVERRATKLLASCAGEVQLDHGESIDVENQKDSKQVASSVMRCAMRSRTGSDFEFWRPPLDVWTELPDPEPLV